MALRDVGALLLIVLTACGSTTRHMPPGTPSEYAPTASWYDVDEVAADPVATSPVPVARTGFQRALQRLARNVRWDESPRDAARALLQAGLEEEWVAETSRGRVLTLLPLADQGLLAPHEAEALKAEYTTWCQSRGGGDCLGLYTDGPYLRMDDRRTLAFALALSVVLDETREALVHEVLNPRAVIATLAWTGAMYLTLWLVPEPITKAAAAVLTVVMTAWLGVDTVWGLMNGWARLEHRAHEAHTFAQLHTAGQEYAKAIGLHSARVLVMAVCAVMGGTAAEVAGRVRSLPGYGGALVQAEAQGMRLGALAEVEAVAATSEGQLAVMMRGRRGGGSAGIAAPGRPSVVQVLRHRSGNQQVVLDNGQRWHLPRGRSPKDIPSSDSLGDELQEAAHQAARRWGRDKLKPNEQAAIDRAHEQGEFFQALRLEGQARGRWIHEELKREFRHLEWNHRGVDVKGPNGSAFHYEVLAGTADNFGRHGRRMSDVFFRMIFF